MPIYEYQCNSCDHRLEKIQKFSDSPLQDCPECGNSSLKKLVSAASFRLKGTGWYETDFKDKPKNKDNGKEKKTNGKAAGTDSSANTDSKKSTSSTPDTKSSGSSD